MLKINGEILNIGQDSLKIGNPLVVEIDLTASDVIFAETFDRRETTNVLLLTEQEMEKLNYLFSIKPEEGEVPESAKKLAVVHGYFQAHIHPQQIMGGNSDAIVLELTKLWADMEGKESNNGN